MKKKIILAVTTYNRRDYLDRCISSWKRTRSPEYNWELIVADDGSTDGTLRYLDRIDGLVFRNKQIGVSYQTNMIIKELEGRSFDHCFKVDDDLFFKNRGWDRMYLDAVSRTGYAHLIFLSDEALLDKRRKTPVYFNGLVSRLEGLTIPGAFLGFTKEIIEKIGYFDCKAFGPASGGHVDYSRRCFRANFNCLESPFDIENSNYYLGVSLDRNSWRNHIYNLKEYPVSINDTAKFIKYSDSRLYVPMPVEEPKMTTQKIFI